MLFGLHETAEPLRVVAIFAGFKYGHVTVRYSPQRDLWAMPRHRMAPPGGLSVLPGPVLAGGESSEWATRITLIPRFQTPHEPSQPQSQNGTLRNGLASDRKGPTPRKDEHTGNNTVTNAIPRIVYRKCVARMLKSRFHSEYLQPQANDSSICYQGVGAWADYDIRLTRLHARPWVGSSLLWVALHRCR